jgi:5-methylthioadenosine/S-adenosylhomocysteine deaminase
MRTLIQNVTVITLDDAGTILQDVDIAIEANKIDNIGQDQHDFEPDEVIDGRGMVALPAFFSAHTHAAMTLERGWAEDLPFDRWLNEKIWVAESALEAEDVYWGAALACCEMIRAGIVGFNDHYFWMDQVAKAVDESGMKACLAWCQFGIGAEHEVGGVVLEDTIEFVRQFHTSAEGRIRCVLGPHSPYMCPPEFLTTVVEEAGKLEVGIHLHVAESEDQVSKSMADHGRTPVAHLAQLGVFERPTTAAHCIVVSDEDLSLLADSGVHVAHTPKTYMKLAMGMAPLERYLEAGVSVGLGTDGPASNNDLNLLEVLRITGLVHKNRMGDPARFPLDQLLRLATQGSAHSLGFGESGVIQKGSPADLVLFDSQQAHWMPRHDLMASVVYASHPGDLRYVICDGQVLLRNGELTTLDEERILFEAERRAFRMVGTPMRQVREYTA